MPDSGALPLLTKKPVTVRLATEADEGPLLNLLMAAYAENAIFAVNPEKVLEAIRLGTQRKGGIIGVVDGHGEIAGSVGLLLEQYWYSDEWSVGERWNFVRENYRATSYGRDLIEFAKWSSDEMGLALQMGVMSTKRTKAKVKLYERKMQMIGAYFIHGLDRAAGPLGKDFQ